jgi:hypothetical protein
LHFTGQRVALGIAPFREAMATFACRSRWIEPTLLGTHTSHVNDPIVRLVDL